MERRVEDELERVLRWTKAVADQMHRNAEHREAIQASAHAYVGGVLTTLDHLELINSAELAYWAEELTAVLGDPPGGWAHL